MPRPSTPTWQSHSLRDHVYHYGSPETTYLDQVFDPNEYPTTFRRAVDRLRAAHLRVPFDAVAFRGTSGAALAFPLALELRLDLIHVCKPGGRHTLRHVEYFARESSEAPRVLVVDDFVVSGKTLQTIFSKCDGIGAVPVGVYLYRDGDKPRDIIDTTFPNSVRFIFTRFDSEYLPECPT